MLAMETAVRHTDYSGILKPTAC